ncbi:MAG: GtrA family protein [Lachnospiraceae bacterium]|nr:GtrA family protein [Lachnospiraceae bacterium]
MMINKILTFLEKYINRETISYLFFGVVTTIVNYSSYFGLRFFNVHYLVANTIAWIAAVTTSYVTNKLWVFHSKSWESSVVLREIVLFAGARVLSLGLETIFMALTVELLHFDDRIMKLIAEVFVVIINYIFSKLIIFKKKE